MIHKIINTALQDWQKEVIKLASSNHLICTGKKEHLQWFGTNLIQVLGKQIDSETSPIYGKLAVNFDDFCYQLCHSTPWNFEMGKNLNAVVDVLRGETKSQNKFFIFYNAESLYLDDLQRFKAILNTFFIVSEENENFNQNLKVIILLEENEKISVRRLLRHKEKYPIEVLNVIYKEN